MTHNHEDCQLDFQTANRAQLIAAYDTAIERAIAAEEKAAELAAELYWQQGVISNRELQGGTKAYLVGVKLAIGESMRRGNPVIDGKVLTPRERIAHYSGLSVDSVSSQGKTAEANGLIERKVVSASDGEQVKKVVYLAIPAQVLKNPSGIAVTTVRHGGARVATCPNCHTETLRKTVTFTCTGCGEVFQEDQIVLMDESTLEEERRLIAEAEREKLAEEAKKPTSEPPNFDCRPCSYRLRKPTRAWKWDLRIATWVCANEEDHDLPRIEQAGD